MKKAEGGKRKVETALQYQPVELPKRLTVRDLAARLRVSMTTARRLTPKIAHLKVGKFVLFPVEAVEKFEAQYTVDAV